MAALAVDLHEVRAAAGKSVLQGAGGIEAGAALLQRGHREARAEPDLAGVGGKIAGQQIDQSGLAGSIGPDDPKPVPTHHAGREILDDDPLAIGFADLHGLDDELAGKLGLAGLQPDLRGRRDALAALGPHPVEVSEPLDVPLAPARDAVTQPMLLGDDLAVGLVPLAFLLLQLAVPPRLEVLEAAIEMTGAAAIEPDGLAGEVLQETAVMADQDEGRAQASELFLEPDDGRQIEMVGRLVQQQNIGLRGQGPHRGGPPPLPAREPRRVLLASKAKAFQQLPREIGIVERREPGLDIGHDGREVGKVGLLRKVSQARAGLEKALAGVEVDLSGGDLEQGRFARAIASDKAQPRAGRDRQIDAFEQGLAAEREGHALQGQQRRRSHESFRVKGIRRDGFSHARGRLVEAARARTASLRARSSCNQARRHGRRCRPGAASNREFPPRYANSTVHKARILD